ncbi:MAG: chaperone modulator CbpM [Bdellovibrionia bacterium]
MPIKTMPKNLNEACSESGVNREVILSYVEKQWIHATEETGWMDEDIRRAHLIIELQRDFGVNDEAVPIILHLIDQLHAMHRTLKKLDLEKIADISLK